MLFTVREYQYINGDRSITVIQETDTGGIHIRKPLMSKFFKTNWNVEEKERKKRLREYDAFISVLYDKHKASIILNSAENVELVEFAKLKMMYPNVYFRRERNWKDDINN